MSHLLLPLTLSGHLKVPAFYYSTGPLSSKTIVLVPICIQMQTDLYFFSFFLIILSSNLVKA